MSDLQCAVRVFLARHAEAEYESSVISDAGGSLTPRGREQARTLAAGLAGERIARVWSSPMARAVQTAEIAAATLGTDVVVREGLREFGVGDHAGGTGVPDPLAATFEAWLAGDLDDRVYGAESGVEVVERFASVLEELADAHRGEAVLVVSHGGAISVSVPSLASNLSPGHPRGLPLGNCDVIALAGDGDGWVVRSWAGESFNDAEL